MVGLVVHFDPPNDHKDYLHRSGRTARAGASGTVLALVDPAQVRDVARLHDAGRGHSHQPSGAIRATRPVREIARRRAFRLAAAARLASRGLPERPAPPFARDGSYSRGSSRRGASRG